MVPRDWKLGIIVKIHKKGNLSDCSNWKGITLLSVPGKILSKIMYNGTVKEVQNSLRNEQPVSEAIEVMQIIHMC